MSDDIRNPPKPLVVTNEFLTEKELVPRSGDPVIRSFDGRLWPKPERGGGK